PPRRKTPKSRRRPSRRFSKRRGQLARRITPPGGDPPPPRELSTARHLVPACSAPDRRHTHHRRRPDPFPVPAVARPRPPPPDRAPREAEPAVSRRGDGASARAEPRLEPAEDLPDRGGGRAADGHRVRDRLGDDEPDHPLAVAGG